jgi:glycolate oxidase FAD binding subunit
VAVSTRALVDGFRTIVGASHARAVDGVEPQIVVTPGSTGETATAVALAAAEKLAIVPRGSGSTLDQGFPPARVDVVIDLSRLDRIVEYNPDDLTVTVEAGVTVSSLAATLDRSAQFLPIDPPLAATRTLGGLVATNASGPLRARYGTLRDLLLGVRFVQADGVSTWGGSKVVKSVTGYDVPKLMVGSLGTLGVLTELTLRLHARPEAERTVLIVTADAAAAQQLVACLLDSSLQPNRLEVLDAAALAAVGGAATGVGIAVSFGSVEAAVVAQEAEVIGLARTRGAASVTSVARAFWAAYERLWRRDDGATLLTVGALPARLADTLDAVARAGASLRDSGFTTAGCAVVGSFRVRVGRAPAPTVAGFIERLRAAVGAWGGSVMVQGAPREVRAAVDPWGPVPPDTLAIMRSIKATFDPDRRLNPGRFVAGL